MAFSVGPVDITILLNNQDLLMLAALIAITVISFFYMRKARKNRVTNLGNYKTLKEVHHSKNLGSPIILIAKIAIVTLIFLAATDSVQIETQQPVTDSSYVIAIDTSQSMLVPDYEPTRIEYAKQEIREWIDDLPFRARMSVLEFSSGTEVLTLMTLNEDEILEAVGEADVNLEQTGTTINNSIRRALTLGESNNNKKILMVTDGKDMSQAEINSSLRMAQETEAEIHIFEIPRNNETEQLYQQLNLTLAEAGIEEGLTQNRTESLQRIAEASGGKYYEASDGAFFQAALENTYTQTQDVDVDSSFYILLLISGMVISEMFIYSRYGAL